MAKQIFDYQILNLTEDFYRAYPNPPYTEILKKMERPYNCLLIETSYDYYLCVPYRTEISHSHAYKFTDSYRSKEHKSGLDYTKIVIITNPDYLCSESALVDDDEFVETMQNMDRIVREANEFVTDYVNHCKGIRILHYREFERRYQFSPLKYFHRELGI